MSKNRIFNPKFKAQTVLETYEVGNVAEVANMNDLHESVVRRWRRLVKDNLYKVFENKTSNEQKEIEELYKSLGKLKFENDFLKKVLKT
jgi:transposase-like protein